MEHTPEEVDQPETGDQAPERSRHRSAALVRDQQYRAWGWLRAAALLVAVYVGYLLAVIVGGWLRSFEQVVLLTIFAIIITLMAEPPVRILDQRFGWPRAIAAIVVLLALTAAIVLLMYLTYIPVRAEITSFASQIPSISHSVQTEFSALQHQLDRHGIHLSLTQYVPDVAKFLENVVPSVVSGTLGAVVDIILVLVVSFWFLKDGEHLRSGLTALFPQRLRTEVDFLFDAFAVVIGGYVRAQLATALIIALLAAGGCALIGVPYPLIVGVAVGVFELIPLVGPFVGMAVACLLALTVSLTLMVWTIVVFIVIHFIEAYIATPRLQAHFVRLHPVVIILAIVAGVSAAGFLGALFAVPLVSLVSVLIQVWVGGWKENRPDLFRGNPDRSMERNRRRFLRQFRLFGR